MNYRHAYHAGNFADVLKHSVLARLLALMAAKAKPLMFADLHAGAGRYDLCSPEAFRTGEAGSGVEKLWQAAQHAPAPLANYLGILRGQNAGRAKPLFYPGSPSIAASSLRAEDRLLLYESHALDHAALARLFASDRRVQVLHSDGWAAPRAILPPRERRGLILIDPPFEEAGDYEREIAALEAGYRRFSTGVFVIWYPIKDEKAVGDFKAAASATAIPRILCLELRLLRPPSALRGAGLLIVNPTWPFAEEFPEALSFLGEVLDAETAMAWLRAAP